MITYRLHDIILDNRRLFANFLSFDRDSLWTTKVNEMYNSDRPKLRQVYTCLGKLNLELRNTALFNFEVVAGNSQIRIIAKYACAYFTNNDLWYHYLNVAKEKYEQNFIPQVFFWNVKFIYIDYIYKIIKIKIL